MNLLKFDKKFENQSLQLDHQRLKVDLIRVFCNQSSKYSLLIGSGASADFFSVLPRVKDKDEKILFIISNHPNLIK